MNNAQRVNFLKQIRLIKSQIAELESKVTRFERLLTPGNILDKQKETATAVSTTSKVLATPSKRNVTITGRVPLDPMFDLEIEFSDEGDGFSNPLVNPVPNGEYYVRCRLRQHQGEPLLQGFQLSWQKPTGWTWVDGIGSVTTDEANSNPLVVTRVAKAPATARGGKFRIVVLQRYFG